jgi:hypothetical protein
MTMTSICVDVIFTTEYYIIADFEFVFFTTRMVVYFAVVDSYGIVFHCRVHSKSPTPLAENGKILCSYTVIRYLTGSSI